MPQMPETVEVGVCLPNVFLLLGKDFKHDIQNLGVIQKNKLNTLRGVKKILRF